MSDQSQRPTPTLSVWAAVEECSECGIAYSVPHSFQRNRRGDGEIFYCPNGHEQNYDPPEPAKPTVAERQELVAALHRAEQAEAVAADATAKLNGRRRKAVGNA